MLLKKASLEKEYIERVNVNWLISRTATNKLQKYCLK